MNETIRIILYLGAVQGFLLSVFLFSIRTNKISNRLLALLTLCWGVVLLTFALIDKGLYLKFPHLLMSVDQLLFLFFPLLYLQVKYLLEKHGKFLRLDLFHFLPFLLSIILNMEFFLLSGEEKLMMKDNPTQYFDIFEVISNEIIALQGIIYSILSLRLIRSYQKKIKDYQSTLDKSIIKVLYVGISLNLFSWVIGTLGLNLEYLNVNVGFNYFVYTYLILVVVIYIISYAAVKSPEIFKLDIDTIRDHSLNIKKFVPKRIDPELNDQEQQKKTEDVMEDPAQLELNDLLISYMDKEKPFLNPELSLPELANSLEISRNQLSSVINKIHNKNFYEFVNQYRVDEVERLMEDPKNKHLKLISLAYDAGFNSKASFYRIFKQLTGKTPTQYLEALK
ncbi:MAG: AraC family transcriptional regulator [Bacteroidales bacterium]|nr:AraC family transcriptional regulator [Bacteroidales bacterium]MCF8405079.1 AraC family transcriptional regulator [Bacteroidales bacterium]